MPHRKTLIVAPLVALAIAAPAAQAIPVDPRQLDMHASTVQKPEPQKQDLRTEAAADASVRPQTGAPAPVQDLRSEAVAGKAPETPVGLPVWPRDPQPIVAVSQEPVATGGGDGIEWPLAGIVIAGALLLGGTLGVAGTRRRLSHA